MEKLETLALDAQIVAESVRKRDKNNYLHVATSRLTQEQVAPYYGREIPRWKEKDLDPERIYYGYRAPDELEKAVDTFNGVPLLIQHKFDSAENPNTELRVGTVGTSAKWEAPYITNALSVWNEDAIQAIENGSLRDLSCGYRYDPDFTPGKTPDGVAYDFVMRNIACNHVALVRDGRAPDCYVEDSLPQGMTEMDDKNKVSGACDDFTEFARKVIESANVGLAPEKIDALVRAFAEAHANFEQERAAQAKQDVDGTRDEEPAPKEAEVTGDEDETKETSDPKEAQDEETEEKKDETQGAQDAAIIARTVRTQIKAQYQAAADVKDAIGAVEPMAFDSADDIYMHAIRQMGFKEKIEPSAARSVFLALRSVKEKTPAGAEDSNSVSNSFLNKFFK